ncbi:hypothetical protein [Thalassovita mangrovi]|uniref:Uncharacterized protein n=1 Tax=Thalassovita mangrovi TaxID=2692236 RepID=A0A6L8LUQ1_9RHOB|nr:hypothetical protein [Thalassovita mangrovi]MYM57062.1 hypothetical protein [Thalassovita mangrovi]
MLELETTHSHLYPGARGRVVAGAVADGPVTLIFADGARAAATLTGNRLQVAAHETAKGTAIAAKGWAIAFDGADFRITARAG